MSQLTLSPTFAVVSFEDTVSDTETVRDGFVTRMHDPEEAVAPMKLSIAPKEVTI